MRVYKSLKPGLKGTKELTEQFGDTLVRVRYRIDEQASKVYKTVELVVEERLCKPTQPNPDAHQELHQEPSTQEEPSTPNTNISTTITSPHPAEPVHRYASSSSFFWFRFRGYLPVLFKIVMQSGACKGNAPDVWGLPTNVAKRLGLLESDLVREVTQK